MLVIRAIYLRSAVERDKTTKDNVCVSGSGHLTHIPLALLSSDMASFESTHVNINEQYNSIGDNNTFGPVGVTRVMSPNETSHVGMDLVPLRQSTNPSNHSVLMGFTDLCRRCGVSVTEPSI